jgi:carboxyl-terminal processing protease
MANEFLHKGDVIVYTEGVNSPRSIECANGRGNFQNIPLVVLTDETSASASEIIAGTIQDNDRGIIIGRRTFGKGLVQQPFEFKDGSAIRLTIARYYTPSGRCIQKPYVNGEGKEYEMDIINRYERGEFFSKDSIHQNDSLVYKTRLGRTVYGGGGIMPDIFVASDTTRFTPYISTVSRKRLVSMFAFKYCKEHRSQLEKHKTYQELTKALAQSNLVDTFIAFAKEKGIKPPTTQLQLNQEILAEIINSNIIYNIQGMLEHVKYINLTDPTVLKAIEVLENNDAFPQL